MPLSLSGTARVLSLFLVLLKKLNGASNFLFCIVSKRKIQGIILNYRNTTSVILELRKKRKAQSKILSDGLIPGFISSCSLRIDTKDF